MFSGLSTHDLAWINNWHSADQWFNRAHKWRGGDPNQRSLRHGSHKKYLTINKYPDGSYGLRYHSTDVVTYHPNDTVTFRPWRSRNTDIFARYFAPAGVYPWFDHPIGNLLGVRGQYMDMGGADVTLKCDDLSVVFSRGREKIKWPVLHRTRASEALKASRANEFLHWAHMIRTLTPQKFDEMARGPAFPDFDEPVPTFPTVAKVFPHNASDVMRLLHDQEMWCYVVARYGGLNEVQFERVVKQEVYEAYQCVDVIEYDWVNEGDLAKCRKAQTTYRWAS